MRRRTTSGALSAAAAATFMHSLLSNSSLLLPSSHSTSHILQAVALSSSAQHRTLPQHLQHKIAASVGKSERRARERSARPRKLCSGCHRPPSLCVCESLPRSSDGGLSKAATAHTDVLILQHPNEFRKQHFSTVPLIQLVMENCRVKVGYDFNAAAVKSVLGMEGGHGTSMWRNRLLLFPADDAISINDCQNLSPEVGGALNFLERGALRSTGAGIKPAIPHGTQSRNLLILIDGTWTEAKRMVKRSPELLKYCQMVQFQPSAIEYVDGRGCNYPHGSAHQAVYNSIRREPEAHCLSTLEACAKALSLLEPESDQVREVLAAVLKKHVESYLNNALSRHSPRFNGDISSKGEQNRRTQEIQKEIFANDTVGDTEVGINRAATDPRQLGDGAQIRPLTLVDATQIDAWWEHRSASSLETVARCITADLNRCIEERSCLGVIGPDGELRAGILRYQSGSVGMLHVSEEHRRKGYGEAMLRQSTEAIERSGCECTAKILEGNVASEELFAKVGWERIDKKQRKGTGKRRANRKWSKCPAVLDDCI